jgi:mannose-6-phosphate isomerase
MYPLKFENIFKSVVWGGEKIAPFKGVETDQHNIGESWELSGVKGNESVVANGLLAGKTIAELTEEHKGKLLGEKVYAKTGAEFPIIKDGDSCRSILLNGKKLYWLDRQEDLNKLNLWAMRLCFTTENTKEVDQVIASCHKPAPFDPGACTRGLYLRGVE